MQLSPSGSKVLILQKNLTGSFPLNWFFSQQVEIISQLTGHFYGGSQFHFLNKYFHPHS